MAWTSHPVPKLGGIVRAPGDKSCSHRAFILGALAEGQSQYTGVLEGDDVLRTAAAVRVLGAEVAQTGKGAWRVTGTGRYTQPSEVLDFGNSGTGSRLLMGAMAGFSISAAMTGDESLRSRPMKRVLDPLRLMGARVEDDTDGRLPLTFVGSAALTAIDYAPPMASAQVKSAVLLAGLNADGDTIVREPRATRDHTERMLRGFGANVEVSIEPGGARAIKVQGHQKLHAVDAAIPGDPSSAAFLAAAAIINPDGAIEIEGVMSNETRDGFFDMATRMGGMIGAEEGGEAAGERLATISAGSGALRGVAVPEMRVASMIDEFPILGVVAAFAAGETVVSGAEELRVKESDRIGAVVDMLRANGVEAEARPDGFAVQGCGGPPPGGGLVETRHDHRIAMSALVLGTAAQAPVSVDDVSMIDTSYPAFFEHMASIGADFRKGRP